MGTGEDHAMNIAYVFFIYMFGFILPLAIIFTCYLNIIKTIKLKSQMTQTAANQTSRAARDRKLTIMVAAMVSQMGKHYLPWLSLTCSDAVLHLLLVSLCLRIHSRDSWLHTQAHPLILHPGHPHHA